MFIKKKTETCVYVIFEFSTRKCNTSHRSSEHQKKKKKKTTPGGGARRTPARVAASAAAEMLSVICFLIYLR